MFESNSIYKYVACCICQSRTTRAHRLPALSNNEEKLLRYAKWVNFAAIEKVFTKRKYYWICESHFDDSAFCNRLKQKILRTAVPSLNPPIYEGPYTEDGSPPGPTESKDEILLKVFQELINRQQRNEPVVRKRKFYNFVSTSPERISSETVLSEQNYLRPDIQDIDRTIAISKQNSKEPSSFEVDTTVSLSVVETIVSPPNGIFKMPTKTTNCTLKPGSAEKISSITQRKRPLILKKSPASSKTQSSIVRSSASDVSDLLKILSNESSSLHFLSDSDNCSNVETPQSHIEILKDISNINNKKHEPLNNDVAEISNSEEEFSVSNVVAATADSIFTEEIHIPSSDNENSHQISKSPSSVVIATSNEKDEQLDILSAAINSSEILFSEISNMDEALAGENIEKDNKQNQSSKLVKKQAACKKKYYDPVLIDSVLNKMKLKKNGPVCVVTLEKKPDRLFKGFTKSKLVTLYKQQINKNRKNKKFNQGINNNSNDLTKKNRKKRWCTCSIHCHKKSNSSKTSSPGVNVNSSVGVKFEGTAVNRSIINIDPDLTDEELFNVENVFNISTILTNVHDRTQIEQLCQMLIESIFKLKSLNIEGTMAKLQVYIAQVPGIDATRSAGDDAISACKKTSNENIEMNHAEFNTINNQEGILNSFQENDCNQIPPFLNLTNEKGIPKCCEMPVTDSHEVLNINNSHPKPKNVKVKLSTFHDHSYVKQESNYIFQKPEYLVKLINVETYRCPRKTVKPPLSGSSKKQIERHKKVCIKLNNRITHLRELIKKKNKNIKTMHRKIKYLGGIVCQEKGIKRVKYPKAQENQQGKDSESLKYLSDENLQINNNHEARTLIDVNIDQLRMDNVVSINSFDSTSFLQDSSQNKAKKAHGSKTKKNTSTESFDVLYENLIEELCCNEIPY